jgi:NAD-dependent dihydropyrimidine dehydrogenase PreA subunit
MVKILVDNDKCTGCGTCVDVCPMDVFEIEDEKSVPVKTDECLLCRACEVQCPESAIQIIE